MRKSKSPIVTGYPSLTKEALAYVKRERVGGMLKRNRKGIVKFMSWLLAATVCPSLVSFLYYFPSFWFILVPTVAIAPGRVFYAIYMGVKTSKPSRTSYILSGAFGLTVAMLMPILLASWWGAIIVGVLSVIGALIFNLWIGTALLTKLDLNKRLKFEEVPHEDPIVLLEPKKAISVYHMDRIDEVEAKSLAVIDALVSRLNAVVNKMGEISEHFELRKRALVPEKSVVGTMPGLMPGMSFSLDDYGDDGFKIIQQQSSGGRPPPPPNPITKKEKLPAGYEYLAILHEDVQTKYARFYQKREELRQFRARVVAYSSMLRERVQGLDPVLVDYEKYMESLKVTQEGEVLLAEIDRRIAQVSNDMLSETVNLEVSLGKVMQTLAIDSSIAQSSTSAEAVARIEEAVEQCLSLSLQMPSKDEVLTINSGEFQVLAESTGKK